MTRECLGSRVRTMPADIWRWGDRAPGCCLPGSCPAAALAWPAGAGTSTVSTMKPLGVLLALASLEIFEFQTVADMSFSCRLTCLAHALS